MQLFQTSTHDLFSDAFFIKHDRLMFASLYGRDANVLSLFGLLSGSGEQVDASASGRRNRTVSTRKTPPPGIFVTCKNA